MSEEKPKGKPRGRNGGNKTLPPEGRKLELRVFVTPDLAEWLQREAGTERGAVSRYVESLVRKAEIESRII